MIQNPRIRRQFRRDLDDLIGSVEEDDYTPSRDDKLSFRSQDLHRVAGGVSVQWLAKAFRLTRHVVQKKLGNNVRPIGTGDQGQPLYDLPEAAQYLVEPLMDIKTYLKTAKPDQLPDNLRETVWNSKLKRQRWEEKAQHLWRTEMVMEKFGTVLANIRMRLQQLPDRIERITGLSIEQYRLIRNGVDEIQEEIFAEIVALSEGLNAFNQLHDEAIPEDGGFEREDLA